MYFIENEAFTQTTLHDDRIVNHYYSFVVFRLHFRYFCVLNVFFLALQDCCILKMAIPIYNEHDTTFTKMPDVPQKRSRMRNMNGNANFVSFSGRRFEFTACESWIHFFTTSIGRIFELTQHCQMGTHRVLAAIPGYKEKAETGSWHHVTVVVWHSMSIPDTKDPLKKRKDFMS